MQRSAEKEAGTKMLNTPPPRPPKNFSRDNIGKGLLSAIDEKKRLNQKIGALLIDEENDDIFHYENEEQLRVLRAMCPLPIISVEINNNIKFDNSLAINTRREFLPYVNRVVNKYSFNAFVPGGTYPDLLQTLRICGLYPENSTLVVMGYAADHCVKLTVEGGSEKKTGGELFSGALHYGYKIMTANSILRKAVGLSRAPPSWVYQNGIDFYHGL